AVRRRRRRPRPRPRGRGPARCRRGPPGGGRRRRHPPAPAPRVPVRTARRAAAAFLPSWLPPAAAILARSVESPGALVPVDRADLGSVDVTGVSARGRIVGLDLARFVALAGMMLTHVWYTSDYLAGTMTWWGTLFEGRSAALFAVLAGVGCVL